MTAHGSQRLSRLRPPPDACPEALVEEGADRRVDVADDREAERDLDLAGEPTPDVKLHTVGRRWHAAKVLGDEPVATPLVGLSIRR